MSYRSLATRYGPIVVLACTAACAKSKATTVLQPPTSLFIADDLASEASFYVTDAQLSTRLNGSADFSTTVPPAAAAGTAAACIRAMVAALPMTANRINATVDATIDVTACLAEPGVTIASATYATRFWLGCSEDNLSDLDGQALGEPGARLCPTGGPFQVLINFDLNEQISGMTTSDAATTPSAPYKLNFRSLFALQMPSGDPCPVTMANGRLSWLDDCEQVRRSIYVDYQIDGVEDPASGHDDTQTQSYRGIAQDPAGPGPWFSSGSMELTVDNWQGSVTYSGEDTLPTWTMTSSGSSQSGTIDGSNLALKAPTTPVRSKGP